MTPSPRTGLLFVHGDRVLARAANGDLVVFTANLGPIYRGPSEKMAIEVFFDKETEEK